MLKILVVDDHPIVRQGLMRIIEDTHDMIVEDEADNGADALNKVQKKDYDLILLDITMPTMNGIEAMGIMIAEKSCGRVIILSSHTHKRFIDTAINGGAMGYVLKSCVFEDLYNAIKAAAADNLFVSPQTGISISEYKKRKPNSTEPG